MVYYAYMHDTCQWSWGAVFLLSYYYCNYTVQWKTCYFTRTTLVQKLLINAEIKSTGGQVTLQMGDDLLVANVPRDFITKKNNFATASAHISASALPKTLMFVQVYYMAHEKRTKPPPRGWLQLSFFKNSLIHKTCLIHKAFSAICKEKYSTLDAKPVTSQSRYIYICHPVGLSMIESFYR